MSSRVYTIIDAGLSTTESGGFDAAGSDVVISEDEVQQAGRIPMKTASLIEWSKHCMGLITIIPIQMETA